LNLRITTSDKSTSSTVTKVMITGDNASNSGVAGSDEAFKFNLSSLRLEGSYFVQPLFRVERMIDPKKI
jgi:hypothetical protein